MLHNQGEAPFLSGFEIIRALIHGTWNNLRFQGEYFNDEEVRAMLAQEAEEERAKREEDLAKEMHDNTQASEETVKHKTRGILIAS